MPPCSYLILSLFALAYLQTTTARHNGLRHEAVDASRRGRGKRLELLNLNTTITEQCPIPSPTSTRSVLSIVFPSPDASPVEVTAQSQVIKSFIPEMTWCVGPPIALIPVTEPPYLNQSTEYETSIAGTGSCETVFYPTETTVCATTLTGIASKIIVSECDQEITFSSECGFTLETPTPVTTTNSLITPAPTVKRMMTYWLAPWQALTAGETPSNVDIKICELQDDGEMECLRYQEVWEVVVATQTVTSTRELQLTTTVTGPGTLIVETMAVYITDTVETVDLSTTFYLETEIETESISKGTKLVTRPDTEVEGPTSTVYITKKVEYNISKPAPTTTIRVTSIATERVGTITRTRARPRPTFLELPDFEF